MSTTIESPPVKDSVSSVLKPGQKTLTIALAGNPNAGKTSLFNSLTGMRQKVANYPGVTVERKEGVWILGNGQTARLIDLPGLYSLDATSIDERIARDVLTGQAQSIPRPDVILAVVDATNLERNLYLLTQLLEYGRPVVVALTMIDLAEQQQLHIDLESLAREIGVAVIPVRATQKRGLVELKEAVLRAAEGAEPPVLHWQFSVAAEQEINALSGGVAAQRQEAVRDLFSEEFGEHLLADSQRRRLVSGARARLKEANRDWWQEPLLARYRWIEDIVRRTVQGGHDHSQATERIDRILTNKFFGPVILLSIMLFVFQCIFSWARLPMDLIDHGFGSLGEMVRAAMPPGLLTDLLVDGVIAGVGGVLVFLPQIILLFTFIALLEDTGYMARAAFIMDRLMRGVGLHGKAFMPLLSSFACAIPGIMATRTIENPKDRIATIMIAPFMSCSARLPVYTLMIAAFFAERKVLGFISVGALIIITMYILGIAVAIGVAWILKHTILKAPTPPLVMELPPYRMPHLRTILHSIFSRAMLFVRRAGTVILAISIILWVLATFPRLPVEPSSSGNQTANAEATTNAGEQLRQSYAGRAGRLIEPVIAPLGFDWKMGVGLISSFAARETLVSTLSIIYNADQSKDDESSPIEAVRNAKRADGSPAWTPLIAVSMMVFFVLACQCMSTVAVVRRETNSWRWPLFMVGYMTVLAYIASFITYQGGRLLGFN